MLPSQPESDDIAIIGLSCRVAGAESPTELWDNLVSSKDTQSRISRFNIDGFYHPDGAKRKGLTNVQHAYFLDQQLDEFDNAFFSIPPMEATAMDPQHRLLLELTYEAIESAGIPLERFQGTQTAVYTGIFGNDYGSMLSRDPDATPKYNSTGTSNSIAANRLSYFFDLKGPSMSIDTACSSTIVALHQAMSALKNGDADMAVVSGSNLIMNMDMFIHMSELGFLSPTGRCRSFDASGDGYVRAEGVLALILKPVSQALRDGDPIRAVVKGTRINQDGRTQGITLPSSAAQQANLEGLYSSKGFDPADTQYLEAHGTGTAAGDPIELSAIDAVFGPSRTDRKLVVGSVKSCIGHLESCAALAGIVKTVLCLEKGLIPPQMHFQNPNPKIDFTRIEVPTSVLEWPSTANGTRRAGVNSFGFGGTNGACILDYYPAEKEELDPQNRDLLFKVSANSPESLERLCQSYAQYLETSNPSLVDFAHTTLSRRSNLKKSYFFSSKTTEDAIAQLRSSEKKLLTKESNNISTIGAIFTGQGAQWVQMGKQLIEQSPMFKAIMEECDRVLQSLPDGPSWSIIEELSKPKETSRVYISNFSQPLCTALQLGLIAIWRSWGISPSFVMGHSSGEVAAAYTAGMISLRDAAIIAYYRGLFLGSDANPDGPKGAMCAVGLSGEASEKLLASYKGRVALAATNSPSSSTLSGDEDAINEIVEYAATEGIFCRALRVDMAYHSHHMLPMSGRYQQALEDAGVTFIKPENSNCTMFSSVTGKILTPEECTPEYWKTNMVSTVRFTDAVTAAAKANKEVDFAMVELGPHPALKGPASDTLAGLGMNGISIFNSCMRGKPDLSALLDSAASMIMHGVPIDTKNVNAIQTMTGLDCNLKYGTVVTDIPRYTWDHSASFWAESQLSNNYRARKHRRHALLGARVASDDILHPTWRNLLMLKEISWLADLKQSGCKTLPSSIFLLMAIEASRQLADSDEAAPGLRLEDLSFQGSIPLEAFTAEDTTFETHFNATRNLVDGSYRFDVSGGLDAANWDIYCSGTIRFTSDAKSLEQATNTVTHDEKLQDYLNSWVGPLPEDIVDLCLSKTAISGQLTNDADEHEHYPLDPKGLATAVSLLENVFAANGIPATYQLRRIGAVTISVAKDAEASEDMQFSWNMSRADSLSANSNGLISVSGSTAMTFSDMQWIQEAHLVSSPPLKSLFFKEVYDSDITLMTPSVQQMQLSRLLELLTHKWPMADIGITESAANVSQLLLGHLHGKSRYERPNFRSVTILGQEEPAKPVERVFWQDTFDEGFKAHLVFGSASDLETMQSNIRPSGLVCLQVDSNDDLDRFNTDFESVCTVAGIGETTWHLGRTRVPPPAESTIKVFVLDSAATILHPFDESSKLEMIPVSKGGHTLDEAVFSSEFDAVVLDCGEKSVFTSWTGSDLLSWLQPILAKVERLVWVTREVDGKPNSAVPGSFLRTIKAENPAFHALSVHLGHVDPKDFSSTIWSAYHNMVNGDLEMELIATPEAGLQALRYKPDDSLSAGVGLAPPIEQAIDSPDENLKVGLTGVSSVSTFLDRQLKSTDDKICVKTSCSLVDLDDLRAFNGSLYGSNLGQFFAGHVLSSPSSEYSSGELIVGWTSNGTHRTQLFADAKNCLEVPKDVNAQEYLTSFATLSIAFAIVSRARAGPDDTYFVSKGKQLQSAIQTAFDLAGSKRVNALPADFEISVETDSGIRLNGRAIDLHKFMTTSFDKKQILKSLSSVQTRKDVAIAVETFPLAQAQEAFSLEPFSAALNHDMESGHSSALLSQTLPEDHSLFKPNGCYIIVGLGGLGEYLASWMVAHGARSIFAVTRSGPDSDQAIKACEGVKRAGGSLTVLKGDASDVESLKYALSVARKQSPILGIFNMVMILRDTAFQSMSPQQWDEALSVKVKSTQNLHEATLTDKLDFFVLFSSVSAIFGNRTQSNYAAGNAYQNAFASYRRSIGLPAVAVALGAVSGIGVLADNLDLQRSLTQNGLRMVDPRDFQAIMEAAVLECMFGRRSLVVTGFEMFRTVNDKIQARSDQSQVFWAEMPEFGFLLDHQRNQDEDSKTSVRLQIQAADQARGFQLLLQAFLGCVSSVLGYDKKALDPTSALTEYGLDSLNAVSCRYWFFKEMEIDVPVFDIIGCKSINILVERVLGKIQDDSGASTAVKIPDPIRQTDLEVRPMSHSQRRLWFLHRFIADKTVYNLLLISHIKGTVDAKVFQQAWTDLIRRHEVLHSKVTDTKAGLQQIPIADPVFELTTRDVSDEAFAQSEEEITKESREYIFDIENGELVKGWLLRSPSEQRFFLGSHHLAWDRQSVPTVFDELVDIYRGLRSGEYSSKDMPEVPHQFIDYTMWQNQCLSTPEITKPQVDYWASTLGGAPDCVSLLPMSSTDSRPPVKHYGVNKYIFDLDKTLADGLRNICKKKAVTPFMLMASAVTALVYRLTGDTDIVVGIPDGDRGHSAFDSMIGFTVNMLAIRSKITDDMTYETFLENYREACLGAYQNRLVPFDYLLHQLNIPRRTSHSPVFQISVNYQMQGAYPKCDFGDFQYVDYEHHNARTQTDLGFEIEETKQGTLHCVLDFDDSLYNLGSIKDVAGLYEQLLNSIVETEAAAPIDSLNLVRDADLALISSQLRPHQYDAAKMHSLAENSFFNCWDNAVAKDSGKVALIDENFSYTYSMLDIMTNKIANHLIKNGTAVADRVVVFTPQTSYMVLAMYGITRAGAAYVPVDPDFPEERIYSMTEDTEATRVLVDFIDNEKLQVLLAAGFAASNIFSVKDIIEGVDADASRPKLSREIEASDTFCCIFTSGSTGKPKGINILHGSLRYQMEGYNAFIRTKSTDRILLSSAMVFDLSLPAIYGTILFGATMVVASRESRLSPERMINLVVDQSISNCIFTPTQFKILFSARNRSKLGQWKSLRSLVLGGEQIPPWLIGHFYDLQLPEASIYNGYAPAETTVVNSLKALTAADAKNHDIPTEVPLWPSSFAIVDSNMKQVPVGVPGELIIGGPTVNKGYIKRDEATQKVFLQDEAATKAEIEDGHGRVYRTGDRFRLDRDGSLHSCGRIGGDRQVKIRGMRTELGEVENSIWKIGQDMAEYGGVSLELVAVVFHKLGEDDGLLTAYLSCTDEVIPDEYDQHAARDFIRSGLSVALPAHMIPGAYVFLEKMPRTATGKTDYKSLLARAPPERTVNSIPRNTEDMVPLDEVEEVVAAAWAAALDVKGAFQSEDNFFSCGGHSLLLMHVQYELETAAGVDISLADMFASPTIGGMANLLRESGGDADAVKDQTQSKPTAEAVDWRREASLDVDWFDDVLSIKKPAAIILTGATGLAGSHFLEHVLRESNMDIHCIAVDAKTVDDAQFSVLSSLNYWHLIDANEEKQFKSRIHAYPGTLSQSTLGLSSAQIEQLDRSTQAIYHLDSEVSLLKNYEAIRASNVGSTKFLIDLAHGTAGNTKALHYLSTWGVPHLQVWNETQNDDGDAASPRTNEVPMSHMSPGPTSELGYLKARWACEGVLTAAAQRGIPTTIYRSSMFTPAPATGMSLARTDINRRIIAASLHTGVFPDFGSERGGGMTWVTADFLAQAMLHLGHRELRNTGSPRVFHLVSDKHIRYNELAELLQEHQNAPAGKNKQLETVPPATWFKTLKAAKNAEINMHAEVLERMWKAGWVPFQVDAADTLALLKQEADLVPVKFDGPTLANLVVGGEGF